MKTSLAIVPSALVLALTLSGCQSADPETEPANAGDCIASGEVSEALVVEGEFGSEPILVSATPISVTAPERSVLIEGTGDALTEEDTINVSVSMINGTSGELIVQSTESMQIGGPYHDVINDALKCSEVGNRTATAIPAKTLYGEGQVEALGVPGLNEDDTIVLVLDFLERLEMLEQAEGKEVALPEDAPEVDIAANGEPTITIPEGLEAPKELTVYPMIEGEGREVTINDQVVVHYRGIIWRTGEEFDSSWVRGEPVPFPVSGVIRGFQEALVGQNVGSRLVSVVPADDGGYGAEWLVERGYEADDVMVFVLDILSAS